MDRLPLSRAEIPPAAPDRKAATSDTRTAILDAAEAILRSEGHAALSSRRVASVAGLKSKLVHYYFRSMDDLFLALLQRVDERHFQSLCAALASSHPQRALWKISIDGSLPRLHTEFVALASRRDKLRDSIAQSIERNRSITAAVLARSLEDRGMGTTRYPPAALAILMDGAARLIATDKEFGASSGHDETIAFIEDLLDQLEGENK